MDADRGGKLRQESFVRTTKMLCVCLVGCGAALGTVRAIAQADADKMFLMKASQTDLSEIKQSQLALDKTTNPHVKAFAQKMISDHNMLELNMKPFADKNGVMPVTALGPEHQAEYDKLKGCPGRTSTGSTSGRWTWIITWRWRRLIRSLRLRRIRT